MDGVMLFWSMSVLLKICRWSEDFMCFCLFINVEEFIYKVIIRYDCSFLFFIFLVFLVNVFYGLW